MKSKICPACHTTNNPSFDSCYHCGQSFDPNAAVNPLLIKKEAYDAFKLSRFSLLFARENLKITLCFLPWIFTGGLLGYLSAKFVPNIKVLKLVMQLGPATLVLGWCIKYLLPKYSEIKWEVPDDIFTAGLKAHLYALLPAFLIALKLVIVYLPIVLLFKFTPLATFRDNILSVSAIRIPGTILLFVAQSILYAAVYAVTVRYLYEARRKKSA